MSENWTPGPWGFEYRYRPDGGLPCFAEVVAHDEAILRADTCTLEDVNNVRLAASAPALYEALKFLLAAVESDYEIPHWYLTKARDALSNAGGGEPRHGGMARAKSARSEGL